MTRERSSPDGSARTAPEGKRRLRVVVRTLLAQVVLIGAAELYFRTQVPESGTTPFRTSEVAGLSSELRPGFETRYKGIDVRINAIGCRGDELEARDPEVLRVALVGDSFAFGSGVPLRDTLGERLEAALAAAGQPAEVVNFGVPGYCAVESSIVVREKALAVDPDVVLYLFYANDTEAPREYAEIPQDAVIDSMHAFTAGSAFLEWLSVRSRQLASGLGRPIGKRTPEFSRSLYEGGGGVRVRRALTRMRDACSEADVPLVVAGYPHLTHTDVNPFRPIDELAAKDAAELGIPFVDLLEAFDGENDLTGYWAHVFDHHPNGEANARAAEVLAPYLLD